jgi:hypothetical protein
MRSLTFVFALAVDFHHVQVLTSTEGRIQRGKTLKVECGLNQVAIMFRLNHGDNPTRNLLWNAAWNEQSNSGMIDTIAFQLKALASRNLDHLVAGKPFEAEGGFSLIIRKRNVYSLGHESGSAGLQAEDDLDIVEMRKVFDNLDAIAAGNGSTRKRDHAPAAHRWGVEEVEDVAVLSQLVRERDSCGGRKVCFQCAGIAKMSANGFNHKLTVAD